MSKFDGTKIECENRTSDGTTVPKCAIDSLPCAAMSVCRHRDSCAEELTNSEIASSLMTEKDLDELFKLCEESSKRLVEMSDPSTKMVNDGKSERSPLEMMRSIAEAEKELGRIKVKIQELSDMTVFDELADDKPGETTSDESDLNRDRDKENIANGLLVTKADFERITSALHSSSTVDEWISAIRKITGCDDILGTHHIVECSPTERTIAELFELYRSENPSDGRGV